MNFVFVHLPLNFFVHTASTLTQDRMSKGFQYLVPSFALNAVNPSISIRCARFLSQTPTAVLPWMMCIHGVNVFVWDIGERSGDRSVNQCPTLLVLGEHFLSVRVSEVR
jgi:hypothetical protein